MSEYKAWKFKGVFINSPLSRGSTARGSGTGLSLVGPTKVKALLLTGGSLKVWNKELGKKSFDIKGVM